jgi:hypothetical protein
MLSASRENPLCVFDQRTGATSCIFRLVVVGRSFGGDFAVSYTRRVNIARLVVDADEKLGMKVRTLA